MMDHDDLSPGTGEALRGLSRTVDPPRELERRVVGALRRRGEIADLSRRRRRWLAGLGAIAAGVLLFAAGSALSPRLRPPAPPGPTTPPADPRPAFILLLEEDAGFERGAAGEEPRRVAEYRAWAGEIARAGHAISGEKLAAPGVVITADGRRPALPPGAGHGAVAGYFILRAADLAEAQRLAGSCPHLRHGGKIVVRQIEAG